MTAVLADVQPDPQLPRLPAVVKGYDGPMPSNVAEFMQMAEFLSTARCAIQREYQRRAGDVGTLMLRAKALNIEIGIALDHIYINGSGKAGLSAQLIAYLLRRAGIDWETERSHNHVEMRFFRTITTVSRTGRKQRRREKLGTTRFDMYEAVTAKIADTYHWRTWPIACMWARCIARAGREHFSNITLGMSYTGEELDSGNVAADSAADTSDDTAVPDDVVELVQQALSEDATPALIRSDIMARAKKLKLLGEHAGDGLTLQQRLIQIWGMKVRQERDREMTLPADQAMATAGYTPAEPPPDRPGPATDDAWKSLPAGEGKLPCKCSAEALITGKHDLSVCADAR